MEHPAPGPVTPVTVDSAGMGPVARMMMSVAAQAITGYVQFRALVDLLVDRGVFTREELEEHFVATRRRDLERTVDEWFPADIAYHVKMAIHSAEESAVAPGSDEAGSLLAVEAEEMARAQAMQAGGPGGPDG